MKIYREVITEYLPGYESVSGTNRWPVVIDETQLRKADFYVRKEIVEKEDRSLPAGFPRNYPSNGKRGTVEREEIYIYVLEMEFDDGSVMTIDYHEKNKHLWLDAMDVITGLDHDMIFGKRGNTVASMDAVSANALVQNYIMAYDRYRERKEKKGSREEG